MNHTAYEEDFIPWVETQAALLRDRKFELLDIPNLYEELTSMAERPDCTTAAALSQPAT